MQQLKVAGLTAISHLSRLLTTLYIIKQIAVTQGPDGLGLLGNFITLVTVAGTLAGGGISSGLIKYVAEYSGSIFRQLSFSGSALIYTGVASLLTLSAGLVFIPGLTNYIFLSQSYRSYIYFFLIAQLLISFNNFGYGLINGLRKNNVYALIIITGNILAVILAAYTIKHYGQWGAIIAVIAPVICPFIPLVLYGVSQRFLRNVRFRSLKQDSVLLSKFSLMLLCSAICFPIVEMYVRNEIIHVVGIEAAGFWQAITKLSSAYLSFYSLFLTFYFVPIISSESSQAKIVAEVKKMLFFVAVLFILMFIFFLCLKETIIRTVFTDKFLSISDLFMLQMVGDFFRVLGWVIGFVVVAKAITKLYILGEILQAGLFILLSSIELRYTQGLQGVVISYIMTCFLYCVISITAFYYVFRGRRVLVSERKTISNDKY
ncbi:lipopolysaccharide biosynthesis protein [Legionella lansingensis]|uniref:Lipopolysaccharide biosynthesis protein n=1 Tax=Legionella lansingensis TaxID=45067 RepID=A0A0W0VW92_9GAMM|nr:O-antigen translocase [Legionella lansingensis]KTD24351.1 lipopolysaccharide biosynthesis protein [Legionella lansingensis]SNV51706.1 lipopolysaccharide biosynthesis protein [Legionella lansingensis]